MHETLRGVDRDGLERSCAVSRNAIRFGTGTEGIERAEAAFSTWAFARHRHDTYAIGVTTAGIQRFWYRGERRTCLPGQLHVLHPDETHDGGPGTPDGFAYRILYIAPELIRGALDGGRLPFVPDPVHDQSRATARVVSLLADIDEPISGLTRIEIAAAIADALLALSGRAPGEAGVDLRAVQTVRDYLAANPTEQTPATTLERLAGLDRFSIARQFRQAFGTSPDRYRTMRRLELARSLIAEGTPLARVAAEAGFADQSHMSRQFKRAFGVTPGLWATLVASPRPT